ncbi:MAG: TSUP family transporter [Lachnospirales bacterium]
MKKLVSFIVGFINGIFGSGAGSLLVPFLKRGYSLDDKEAHATSILIILTISIVTIFFIYNSSKVDFYEIIYLSIGGVVGGTISGVLLKRLRNDYLNKLFALLLIFVGGKMLF